MPSQAEQQDWGLSDEQRQDTLGRLRANLAAMAFFRGEPIPDDMVDAAAAAIEKKAYTIARVEARTTTGTRPHHETLKAYVRKLGELAVQVVKAGGELEPSASTSHLLGQELDLRGGRDFLTAEAAEALLAPLLAPGAAFTRVVFSTKSFGAEAAAVAARAIRNVSSTLVDADLSDIIAGRPEVEALAALRTICDALGACRLVALDLSDNALGEKGIRAAAAAFAEQEGLQRLAFRNVGCSVAGCCALEQLLRHSHSLRSLHLVNNMSGCEGAAAIARLVARSPAMEDFRMVSSRVGSDGGLALAAALQATTSLVRLDLHDNPLTGDAAHALAASLRLQRRLRALNLNDTCLADEGVELLAHALAHAGEHLEELHLALNEITPVGARALGAALRTRTALRRLVVSENELEDDGAELLAEALAALTSLTHVDVCTNMLGRRGAVAVACAVAPQPGLELLALDDNRISGQGLRTLRAVLESHGKLGALGPLEENAAEESEAESGDEEGDALASAMQAQAHL